MLFKKQAFGVFLNSRSRIYYDILKNLNNCIFYPVVLSEVYSFFQRFSYLFFSWFDALEHQNIPIQTSKKISHKELFFSRRWTLTVN